ncbi:MAG: hypothetical protein LBT89_07565 [Planctomycetaceae bacterium]|jgi:hypothetical protein|nr:hypothetical protein [Planctomycetaceae bacterium]
MFYSGGFDIDEVQGDEYDNIRLFNANPFAAKFWFAGMLEYRFSDGGSADTLLQKIRQHRICQIVGPKGSGKSTLIQTLRHHGGDSICFLDGFEQLPLYRRFGCRLGWIRCVLCVHRPLWGIPVLYRTVPDFTVFRQLVSELYPQSRFGAETLQQVFAAADGNFRTAFFELYEQILQQPSF